MQSFLQKHLPEITRILRKHRVQRAYAFGSACRSDFTEDSDIDLLIAFEEDLDPVAYGTHYFSALDELEQLLQHPIDLVTERSVQTPSLRRKLAQTRQVIYE
jgi:predicted nucleotidyltransferase